jgi:hypothetical protein
MAKALSLSHAIAIGRTGRRLHLYRALLDCGSHDGRRPHPGTTAALWDRIDTLRADGGASDEIRLLEGLSVEVHRLDQSLRDAVEDAGEELMPRVRIAALTREWLAYAPLRG